MKTYRVIWFDDQEKTLEMIREQAQLNDIELIGFNNAESGLEALTRNINEFDAAIVDGKFWRNTKEVGDEVRDTALIDVAAALDKLSNRKKLPWFVLSGQTTFTREKNSIVESYKNGIVYDKLSPEDLVALWSDLKKEVNELEDNQIIHRYSRAFEVFEKGYLRKEEQKPLIQILAALNKPDENFDDELYFTQIRIILESMFRAANRFGLLHNKCINERGNVNLSESSLFLSGEHTKHLGISCQKPHFDRITSEAVWSIISITGAASHTADNSSNCNMNLQAYRRHCNTPYLLYSLTFKLMDILVWFKNYVALNKNIEYNKSLWKTDTHAESASEWIKGLVFNSNPEKGITFFKPAMGKGSILIPPALVSQYKLADDMSIRVIIEAYQDKSGETRTRVKEVKLD